MFIGGVTLPSKIVQLYNSSEQYGTKSNFTISDNYKNYKFIVIKYLVNDPTRLFVYDSRNMPVLGIDNYQNYNIQQYYVGSTYLYTYNMYITFNGNQVTINTNRLTTEGPNTMTVDSTSNFVGIIEIDGLR